MDFAYIQAIKAWANRMVQGYGDLVLDLETGRLLDWGQALCRERYGPDWDQDPPEAPTVADVERALRWERGEWPDWAMPVLLGTVATPGEEATQG